MRLYRRTPRAGHTEITLLVQRWRRPYGWFNRYFAVASHRVELAIVDEEFHRKYLRDRSA